MFAFVFATTFFKCKFRYFDSFLTIREHYFFVLLEERYLLPWCFLKTYMIWLQIAWILLKLARSLHWHKSPGGHLAALTWRKLFWNVICAHKNAHMGTHVQNHAPIYTRWQKTMNSFTAHTHTADYCSPALQPKRLHLDSMNRNFSITTGL